MEVMNFEDLKQLIVVYKIKQSLPVQVKVYFNDDLSNFKNFDIIISKLDDYEDARPSIRIINKKIHNFEN